MTGVGGRPELNIEGSDSIHGPWKVCIIVSVTYIYSDLFNAILVQEYGFLYKPVTMEMSLPFVGKLKCIKSNLPHVDLLGYFHGVSHDLD